MKKNNLLNFKHIFFVGIGGISQSDLAKICLSEGIKVSGSDKEKTHITEELQRIGVNIFYCHSYKNLKNVDLVVYSGAIKKDNEELVMAEKSGIRVMERSEFLGQISSMYKNVIAVSGVHGKTTTTGMLATIFIEIPMVIRNIIIALALVMLLLFGSFNLNILKKTGYYECQECKHQYIPTFNQMFFGMSGITKGGIWRMKCPNCNKKCWHKKVLTKINEK